MRHRLSSWADHSLVIFSFSNRSPHRVRPNGARLLAPPFLLFCRHENAESAAAPWRMRITEGFPPLPSPPSPNLRVSSLLCALKELRFANLHPAQWSASGASTTAAAPALFIGSFSLCLFPSSFPLFPAFDPSRISLADAGVPTTATKATAVCSASSS